MFKYKTILYLLCYKVTLNLQVKYGMIYLLPISKICQDEGIRVLTEKQLHRSYVDI